jgi:hypothetical protein
VCGNLRGSYIRECVSDPAITLPPEADESSSAAGVHACVDGVDVPRMEVRVRVSQAAACSGESGVLAWRAAM